MTLVHISTSSWWRLTRWESGALLQDGERRGQQGSGSTRGGLIMKKDYEALAKSNEDARMKGVEDAGLVPTRVRVSRNADAIYSLRLTSDEMRAISSGARKLGMKLSEFIRAASLEKSKAKDDSTEGSEVSKQLRLILETNAEILRRLSLLEENARRRSAFAMTGASGLSEAKPGQPQTRRTKTRA